MSHPGDGWQTVVWEVADELEEVMNAGKELRAAAYVYERGLLEDIAATVNADSVSMDAILRAAKTMRNRIAELEQLVQTLPPKQRMNSAIGQMKL